MNILSVKSSQETQALASELAALLHPGTVILLDGPLGSGKTTFTQGLGKALGIKRAIKSPTYTIVKSYEIPNREADLVHVDAYRLEEGYAESIDLDSYLDAKSIIFIEWPQYISEFLPEQHLTIEFKQLDLKRRELTLSQVTNQEQVGLDLEQDWLQK